jgi:formylglycine-generating enzyme required for sulfatase activity
MAKAPEPRVELPADWWLRLQEHVQELWMNPPADNEIVARKKQESTRLRLSKADIINFLRVSRRSISKYQSKTQITEGLFIRFSAECGHNDYRLLQSILFGNAGDSPSQTALAANASESKSHLPDYSQHVTGFVDVPVVVEDLPNVRESPRDSSYLHPASAANLSPDKHRNEAAFQSAFSEILAERENVIREVAEFGDSNPIGGDGLRSRLQDVFDVVDRTQSLGRRESVWSLVNLQNLLLTYEPLRKVRHKRRSIGAISKLLTSIRTIAEVNEGLASDTKHDAPYDDHKHLIDDLVSQMSQAEPLLAEPSRTKVQLTRHWLELEAVKPLPEGQNSFRLNVREFDTRIWSLRSLQIDALQRVEDLAAEMIGLAIEWAPHAAVFRDRLVDRNSETADALQALSGDFSINAFLYGPEMVKLDPGAFLMGSPDTEFGRFSDEGPQQRVVIDKPYAIARHPLLAEELGSFSIRAGGRRISAEDDRKPAVGISWKDAQRICQFLTAALGHNYRLPSEAEWEYAARGGTSTAYYWGDDWREEAAASAEAKLASCIETGRYPPNPWRLVDCLGNVFEWCQDDWESDLKSRRNQLPFVADFETSRRVVKGGAWDTDQRYLRTACRGGDGAQLRSDNCGIRLARSI